MIYSCENSLKFFTYCKVKWKLKTRQPFWYNGFTTNTKYSRKETSLHGKIIPNMLPEMQQQNRLLSLRKRLTWSSKISVQEVSPSVGAGYPRTCLYPNEELSPTAQSAENPCIFTSRNVIKGFLNSLITFLFYVYCRYNNNMLFVQ